MRRPLRVVVALSVVLGAGALTYLTTTAIGASRAGAATTRLTPVVTSVTPSYGGSPTTYVGVIITGYGFTVATYMTVKFGTTTAFVSHDTISTKTHETITVSAPPEPAGAVDVRAIDSTDGRESATSTGDIFEYGTPTPAVTGLSPASGPTTGGTTVKIAGTNFTAIMIVTFGGTSTNAVATSSTSVTVKSPAHAAGTVAVKVEDSDIHTSAPSSADIFTFGTPTPAVTKVTPAAGPTSGGTKVVITGTNFSAGASVDFGSAVVPSKTVTVDSPTSITATAPSQTAGTVDVTVTDSDAKTSAISSGGHFLYVTAPTVTGVTPPAGPISGGTTVTITGTNFSAGAPVHFGSAAATTVTEVSTTKIIATDPAHAAGKVTVTVSISGVTSATSPADQFTYVPAPTVTKVTPTAGPTSGATTVTITGTNFSAGASVHFGSAAATTVTEVSPTEITAKDPAHTAATVTVTVTTPGGTSATSAADHFTYVPAPTVTKVTPSSGPVVGGTLVTITGTNLTGANAVTFGSGKPGSNLTVVSATEVTTEDPSNPVATVTVTVTTAGGTSATSPADHFSYVTLPPVNHTSAPPGAPVLTTAVPGTGTVHLAWTAPTTANAGAVAGYEVCYTSTAAALTRCPTAATAGSATSFTLSGLTDGTRYYFAVRAKDAAGFGPLSNAMTATPGASSATRIAGATPDATAAAELERAFPPTKGSCPSSRTVVVATTAVYDDALSSQFLAQSLTTGTLLTPTGTLSPVTQAALKAEGIAKVIVVGGPLAITTTVLKAIEALTAYGCGGKTPSGKVTVTRIYGQTQYATAAAVAEHVGTAASLGFPGAYQTTNPAGGVGRFNDTGGTGTAAPSGPQPTAVLASGTEFQDAQAASVVSYRTKLPLLLTPPSTLSPTALAAIVKLGIKQVIVMGGTLAVANAVEAALVQEAGISVLRVAGKDYTDTAAQLARFEAAAKTTGLGWTPGHRAMVARGNGFSDGIAGAVLDSPHNAATGGPGTARPLLLTETPTVVGTYLTTFLTTTGATGIGGTTTKTLTFLSVLGGPLALSTAAVAAMQADLKG